MTDITSTDNPATAQLNRRAALLGAAATSVAMVTPTVAAPFPLKPVDPVRAPGSLEAEVAIMDAARQFKSRAMDIDPTITGMWIYTDMVDNLGAIAGVHLERGSSFAKKQPAIFGQIEALAATLIDAIEAETRAWRAHDGSAASHDFAEAALKRVTDIEKKLIAASPGATRVPKFQRALALLQRRWLVLEGSYSNYCHRAECRFVDAVLAGSSFDNVSMLWRINGEYRDARPSDAELQAGWPEA